MDNITTKDIMEAISSKDIKIKCSNLDSIIYNNKNGEGYVITVNNNMDGDMIWYFIYHEVCHILMDNVDPKRQEHLFCEYDEADTFALKAYIEESRSKKVLENSPLFKDKLWNKEFKQIFDTWTA